MRMSFSVGVFSLSALLSLSAQADGRCILSVVESLDSNRTKEVLILADHLETSGAAKKSTWASNDGTVKIQIVKATAQPARSELQLNVLVNDVTVLRATGTSTGNLVGTQASAVIPDGRALSLLCIAQHLESEK